MRLWLHAFCETGNAEGNTSVTHCCETGRVVCCSVFQVDAAKGNGPACLIMAPASKVEEVAKLIRTLLPNIHIHCMSGSTVPWYGEEDISPDVQVYTSHIKVLSMACCSLHRLC